MPVSRIILLFVALQLAQLCAGITADQFKCLFTNLRNSPNVYQYVDAINQASTRFSLTMPRRLPLFLAFSGYMSDYYERFVAPENTLCKYAVNGGCTFRGRGALFVAGKPEYKRLSAHFDIDFVAAPHRVSELPYAILSAGWLWHDLRLNAFADVENIEALSRLLVISSSSRLIEFWGRAVICLRS